MDGTTGDLGTDGEFEPTAEMMVNDFDDERTLDEEEALEEPEDQNNELSNLEKEKDMPIEALLAMYGYNEEGDEDGGEQQQEEENLTNQEEEDEEEEEEEEENDVKKEEVTGLVSDKEESQIVNSNIEEVRPPESDEPNDEVEMDCEDVPERSMLQELYKDDPTVGNRQLRSGGSRQQSEEEEDEEEEDGDYSPEEEDWKKTIMVGSDYQAEIPAGLCKYDDAMPYENEDKLLWDPASMRENDVLSYLNEVQDIQAAATQGIDCIPRGSHSRDDEQALYLLLQCGHNKEEAIRRQKINFVSNADSMSLWSEEECRNFETGLRQFGKDFHSIQQNRQVRTRSVSELVQFYYLWKKTERHDVFANKARLEKKKYTLHPGTTDYMERFLDEQDSPVSSPSVHSLLSGDPKRTRTPPPNNNSFNDTSELITEDEAKLITSHYEEIARHLDEKSLESLVKLASSSGVNKNGLSSTSISSPSETSFAQ